MKHFCHRLLFVTLTVALTVPPVSFVHAEDIDLFAGGSPASGANPNVLFILDNSANWSAQNQHWTDSSAQGQSELRALRTVIGGLDATVNVGLMMFTGGSGTAKDGAYIRFAVRPMTATNKAALQELIGDENCVDGPNSLNGTPNCIFKNFNTAAEKTGTAKTDYSAALFEAFKYFGGFTKPANANTDTGGTPIVTTVPSDGFGPYRYAGNPDGKDDPAAFYPTDQLTTYNPPVGAANSCAKNFIIFVGNGFPTQDSPATLLSGLTGSTPTQLSMPVLSTTTTGTAITVKDTGTFATPGTNDARWTDEWAKFLYTTDVNGAAVDNVGLNADGTPKVGAAGQQNVRTYTIDVFKDAQDARQTALLFNMARAGGGKYAQASSENAVLLAMKAALIEIQANNSVFAAASLPVSATNRAQNENQVFFGLFRPDGNAKPRWYGNLKRYQVAQDTGGLILADANGNDAINSASGFFSPCAASFWATDTGTYWNFSPGSAGQCSTASTSVFSDLPDGPLVEKGGAAEVVRRGNNPTTPTTSVNRTMYTCASSASCSSLVAFTTGNVSISALGAADATEQGNIVNYTLGQDVGADGADANQNGSTTDTRPSIHGDIVHSRPLPVNYGGTTGVVVYYGGNDGPLRAVKTNDGTELWSFIAPEHHGKLKRLRDNAPVINYPPPATGSTPKDYFFDGTFGLFQTKTNDQVWIFPTMRRGGRMLYGFDVTSPTAPTLKWRVGCPNNLGDDSGCTAGFSGIGQTWSTPNVALIKGFSTATPVLVVGGGYDTCEDTDSASPPCASGSIKGNSVYIINGDTGALLASFQTDRSVPAEVALVDRDFDGLVDHGYVADTGGNLYRIDFVDPLNVATTRNKDQWTMTKIAQTSGDGRKFQFPPAVFPSQGEVILTLGSGDRERPLVGNYPFTTPVENRFYMFRDKFPTINDPPTPVDLDTADTTKITDVTDSSVTACAGSLGWRMTLPGTGEQVVTSSLIVGGRTFFNTARALSAAPGTCAADLGGAKGYNVNLLCAADRFSVVYQGGGLPISPVQGTTTLANGAVVTFVIGGPSDPGTTTPFTPGKIKPVVSPKRSRTYWYRHGDK